jgi:D-alanyl-D-alanine carboxypeptidase
MQRKASRRTLWVFGLLFLPSAARLAQTGQTAEPTFAPDLRSDVDRITQEVLVSTGVPSASIAIVQGGRIVYVQAYGDARLEPRSPARPEMRYSIGSVSKQFTAAAILMLAEQHKLSLDDPVSKYLPDLTRASEITVRQLLSHTSGYQDYWPQDYVPPFMTREVTAEEILSRWAKKPLDFAPGTEWQYSNTGYVIAGVIAEKASGVPLWELLRSRVFTPLAMESVTDVDRGRLTESDPVGYLRYGLGPRRVAPKEGKGWLFAAGEIAMTARDLAKWNIALIEHRLLSPASSLEMETAVRLKNGLGTRYGLGLNVATQLSRRALSHGGEVSGFTASNTVFPDDRAAITVLTNLDAAAAASTIANRIAPLLFRDRASSAAQERARRIFEGLQTGKIDRSQLTDNANSYFTELALRDFAEGLRPLGAPLQFEQAAQQDRGGMTFRRFDLKFAKKTLQIWERDMPDGKIEQFQVMARD